MIIRTLVVYDKAVALANFYDVLSFFPEFAIETCNLPEKALAVIKQQQLDVVFINLEINKAIELVAAIRQINPAVMLVLVAERSDYAIQAFELNAQDYLIKPITRERMAITAEKVNYLLGLRKTALPPAPAMEVIPGKYNGRIYLLKVRDILYLTTAGRNVFAVAASGLYKLQGSLSYWEEQLPRENFFRCHNGYIVNLAKIEYIAPFFKNAYSIKISGSTETVPVSRTFAKGLKERVRLKA